MWKNLTTRPANTEKLMQAGLTDPPLRAELFSIEQLASHARTIATAHQVITNRGTDRLLIQLSTNESKLRAFNLSTQKINPVNRLTPAAEWILDNFYIIEEQIQMARRHLPRGYCRELPRVINADSISCLRVYDIVQEFIKHVDAEIDAGQLGAFIDSYQTVDVLKIGELWAIPIMLRLGLIENLQRIATRLSIAREDSELAGVWVDLLQETAVKNPSGLVFVIAEMVKSDLRLSSSFVAEFSQRMSQHSPVLHLARTWLENHLAEEGSSIEQMVYRDSQNQAADQVSVSHSISSLRFLSAMNWKEFVETMSRVEGVLRSDAADVYSDMDFATRDHYRHRIETISRQSEYSEVEVAELAVKLSNKASKRQGHDARTAHVGFYLIDKGQAMLEKAVKLRRPWSQAISQCIHHCPLSFYAGGVLLITVLATFAFMSQPELLESNFWFFILFGLLFIVAASQLAVALMNWISTLLVKPRLLPRLDFTTGIPSASRTMVVVPTMLSSLESVDRLIESLEIHHLANRDPNLHFALLTDFRDASEEVLPCDEELVNRTREGIEMLNLKYPSESYCKFYLFHRSRRWNEGEEIWMGYERKRGKLEEFNSMLRGGCAGCFSVIIGVRSVLHTIKYVITLDTDTQLPRDTARRLVGTMDHPLNRPVFDKVRGVVAEGYGILQPRIGVSLPSARKSWFVRIFAGDAGIDPYTREVSDVYQDVFREGSFIGKGIYDVDAFQRAMLGRFPENTVLSHDLLEACHARSALVSDVEFYEEYPSRYNVDIDRRHRWIRGDWQITQWLLPRVPGPDARRVSNPLSALSRWKIFDNLRRSIVPIALMLLVLGAWILLPEIGEIGVLWVIALIILPGILSTIGNLIRKPHDLPWMNHLRAVGATSGRQIIQIILTIAFLPYDAFISLDAICKTLMRLLVTHKCLLEWRTSSDAEGTSRSDLVGFFSTMWIAPVVAVVIGIFLLIMRQDAIFSALPILILWLAAPYLAWWISLPIASPSKELNTEQVEFLRNTARKTWHYFETFVTVDDNWLPPDNYQETPEPVIATRTSPTNMGMALLANLSALDFGYLTVGQLIKRTQDTLSTMQGLERYRGHFYNWYDTRTLLPLQPPYISSVDSGNLAGHLLVLGAGLRELADTKIFSPMIFSGLRDTLNVLKEFMVDQTIVNTMETELESPPTTLRAAYALLLTLSDRAARIASTADPLSDNGEQALRWSQRMKRECDDHLTEVRFLATWPSLPIPFREQIEGDAFHAYRALEQGFAALDDAMTLRELANCCGHFNELTTAALEEIAKYPDHFPVTESQHIAEFSRCLEVSCMRASERLEMLETLAIQCDELAEMDFTFLFDSSRKLFSIGFNISTNQCDASFYDLLASEARLCSYVAIALGQIPQDHWFSLGRLLVSSRGQPLLVSWSGSMFEYLMPLLVMPTYENTLLDHTCKAAVQQQIAHGKAHKIPWGVSESGYNRRDLQLNYQYHAFGVPGLGLKRGLSDNLVISPYASAMALMVAPRESCENLQRLAADGRSGTYGFYEAVDYTPSRIPPGKSSATIRSYMVHHQGMSLLALDNLLLDNPMLRRFMACPMLKAADLLLQERVPKTVATVLTDDSSHETKRTLSDERENVMRVFTNPSHASPDVHLLSNGSYHVAISSAGGGYSRWHDLMITRWREDATRDNWGTFIYLRDLATEEVWSSAYQPTLQKTANYEAVFTQSQAEFRHSHAKLDVHTEISVSPEDDVELRRVTINNRSSIVREIELTSYAEVVLAPAGADAAHPAFSNLFVQSEFVKESSAILCSRRPRNEDEMPPYLLHMMVSHQGNIGEISCETDRSKFVGRGKDMAYPAAMQSIEPLSNTVGSVLDPIVSLRRTISIPANGTVSVTLILGVAVTRDAAMSYVEKYQSLHMTERAFDMAWTHNLVTLHHLNVTVTEAQLYGRIAGSLIYVNPIRRANPGVISDNKLGRRGLWSYGISGDAAIILLRISDASKIEIVCELIRAHSYWRMKGLTVDLVILHEDVSVYRQSLGDQITNVISSGNEAQMREKPGGIFVRSLDQIPNDDLILLQACAHIVFDDEKGTLKEQVEQRGRVILESELLDLKVSKKLTSDPITPLPAREIIFDNGHGGFTKDGQEYIITIQPGETTPAPWVNVLANPDFGTVVSEAGSTYTWAENSHEFRLTPWSNDPVRDPAGEAFYIRDEETGEYWSPSPSPARGETPYVIRHGFGYTIFEHTEHGIFSKLTVYVAMDASVKFTVMKLKNISGRPRRISVTGYWEWVLGEFRSKGLLHVRTEIDIKSGALLARNYDNTEFPGRIVFVDVDDADRSFTGDRREFIGRNSSLSQPAAMKRKSLSGKAGAGLDPCGAVQVKFNLTAGEEHETAFRLGVGKDMAEVDAMIQRFRAKDACGIALEGVWSYWNKTLGAVNVDTPDPAVNVMANGWLLYQTISCRLWGRTGFYQSGGAYGFRDQLQDVMALVHAQPALTREHLLRAAARQFREGDVQHWWHPPAGRGVRTQFSDDYLWLPFVTTHYISCIADSGILDEVIPFLESRQLKPGEEANYDLPNRAEEPGTLYEHCVRSIERSFALGSHGLPLIGCGDWNDGMNWIGKDGRGESVWLAFFLYDVLTRFAPIAIIRNDQAFADRCIVHAKLLQQNIESNAWDGDWYLRAFFDNGDPLGSKSNLECQIDSLPQSWSVISGAGDPSRSHLAMESVDRRLVRRDVGLIQLFDPPFDKSPLNPGYIKSYIPGVRENGGQYTHGAIWTAMAFAKMGYGDRAWELFSLLNPVNHGGTAEAIATYKIEPYVIAADVYAVAPHTGRGGWSWYTGSAAWMYRLLVDTLLGINLEGEHLRLAPHLPKDWDSFKVHYRYRQTVYHITITRAERTSSSNSLLILDGTIIPGTLLPLTDDQREHFVDFKIFEK